MGDTTALGHGFIRPILLVIIGNDIMSQRAGDVSVHCTFFELESEEVINVGGLSNKFIAIFIRVDAEGDGLVIFDTVGSNVGNHSVLLNFGTLKVLRKRVI